MIGSLRLPSVRRMIPAVLAAGLCLLCSAARAQVGGALPEERAQAQTALGELARASKDGNWGPLQTRVRTQIFQRLAAGNVPNMAAMNDLVFVLRSCQYLPLADQIDPSRKLSLWLAANRDAARLLYRAMQEVKSPEDSLRKFQVLLAAEEKSTLAYASLAVAFATSQPLVHYVKQPNPSTPLEAFRYYTKAGVNFRYDLKAMPFEFSRFLADTQLSLAERQWAQQQFGNAPDLAAVYFQVKFDHDYFFRGRPKKLSRAEYTLPNIANPAIGGVCFDAAYCSSEVCKALGQPAAIVSGQGIAGGAHGWLAYLKIKRSGDGVKAEWDAQTGRYEEHKFYTGLLTDPATGNRIHDSELALLGAAALLPLDRREEADAATALAALAAEAVKNRPAELAAAAKIEPAIVEKLLFEAARNNLAYRRVWDLVIELRKAGGLSTDSLDRLFEFLVSRTAKDFPDYGCTLMIQIVPTYEPARREPIYRKAIELYAHRPDLQGQLIIALGDDRLAQGRKDLALSAYQEIYTSKLRELTEVLLIASRKAADMMEEAKHRDDAIVLYRKLFADAPRPTNRNGAYHQTAFYQLGKHLAELLQEESQAEEARQILLKIGESGGAPEAAL